MVPYGSTPVARLNLAKNEAAEEVLRRRLLLFVVLKTRQLLVPVRPEYWIFKMAFPCYFLVLSHGLALFAVSRCYSGSISNFLIFPLPVDHSWQRNREEKSWRGLKTNKKGSAYIFSRKSQLVPMHTYLSFLISSCSNEPKWLQFGCQSFIILLVVRYRSIQKRPIFGSLADAEVRSGKIRRF